MLHALRHGVVLGINLSEPSSKNRKTTLTKLIKYLKYTFWKDFTKSYFRFLLCYVLHFLKFEEYHFARSRARMSFCWSNSFSWMRLDFFDTKLFRIWFEFGKKKAFQSVWTRSKRIFWSKMNLKICTAPRPAQAFACGDRHPSQPRGAASTCQNKMIIHHWLLFKMITKFS